MTETTDFSGFTKVTKNIFCEENQHEVFECLMKDGEVLYLQAKSEKVGDSNSYLGWNYTDPDDLNGYQFTEVESFKPLCETLSDECLDEDHIEDSTRQEMEENLLPYKIAANTYQYKSMEDFKKIVENLAYPIAMNLDSDYEKKYKSGDEFDVYVTSNLAKTYGLIYYWESWEDFQDSPYRYFAVIDGGCICG